MARRPLPADTSDGDRVRAPALIIVRRFITGSADDLGRAPAGSLTDDGHEAPDVLPVNVVAPHHRRRTEPAPAVRDERLQDELVEALARFTATPPA